MSDTPYFLWWISDLRDALADGFDAISFLHRCSACRAWGASKVDRTPRSIINNINRDKPGLSYLCDDCLTNGRKEDEREDQEKYIELHRRCHEWLRKAPLLDQISHPIDQFSCSDDVMLPTKTTFVELLDFAAALDRCIKAFDHASDAVVYDYGSATREEIKRLRSENRSHDYYKNSAIISIDERNHEKYDFVPVDIPKRTNYIQVPSATYQDLLICHQYMGYSREGGWGYEQGPFRIWTGSIYRLNYGKIALCWQLSSESEGSAYYFD